MDIKDILIGVLGVLGLIALVKPDVLKSFYGWQSKAMGATVIPPKSFAIQYRISGVVLLALVTAYFVYVR